MHIFFFLDYAHFNQHSELKRRKAGKVLLNVDNFFFCFDLPGSDIPMCVMTLAQLKVRTPVGWWCITATMFMASCTIVPQPPGICLKAMVSLLQLRFPSSSGGWGFTQAAALGAQHQDSLFTSTWHNNLPVLSGAQSVLARQSNEPW